MAGPQFIRPHPASASRPRRRFTVEQANATLPLVRRVVGDIVHTHEDVARLQALLEQTPAKDKGAIESSLQKALEHLQDYVDELLDIGCDLKDYKIGLVDFVGRHKGHDICLCWKLGEDAIAFWHDMQSGFAGRQPISTLDETAPAV